MMKVTSRSTARIQSTASKEIVLFQDGILNISTAFKGGAGGVKGGYLRADQWVEDGRIWEVIDGTKCCTPSIPATGVLWDGVKRGYVKSQGEGEGELEKIYSTGEWCVVGGKLTWISPWHYLALNHWPAGLDTEDGMKEFRDKDRRRWLHFYTGFRDDKCFGQLYLKRRRDGASTDGGMLAFWFTSAGFKRDSGITSHNDSQAQEALMDFVKMPFFSLPEWLKPIHNTALQTKELRLMPKDGGKTKNEAKNGKIYTKPPTGKSFDGKKLAYLYMDEAAKWSDKNVVDYWATHLRCLKQGPRKVGYAFITSTVEEMGKNVEQFRKLYAQADTRKVKNGSTVKGLWSLFIPAYDGYDEFIDEYGDSIIDNPTDEQWAWMQARYGAKVRQGAREYQAAERARLEADGDSEGLQKLKRQEPWTVQEAFDNNNTNCHFNLMILSEVKRRLEELPVLWQRGNFVYTDKAERKVAWAEDDKSGRFWVSWFPPSDMCNMITETQGGWRPVNRKLGVIGVDPYGSANVQDAKRCSSGSAHGKLYFNLEVERANKVYKELYGRDRAGYWPTPSIFLRYHARPTSMKIFYEDVLKASIFYGMPVALERNVNGMEQYFMAKGFAEMMLTTAEMKNGVDVSNVDYINRGIYMNPDLAVECMELINNFVEGESDWLKECKYRIVDDIRRLPFIETVQDMMDFDNTNRTKYDDTMSLMQVHKAEWGMTDMSSPFFRGSDASAVLEAMEEEREMDTMDHVMNKRVRQRVA
jgi:hypothetical protein